MFVKVKNHCTGRLNWKAVQTLKRCDKSFSLQW